MKTKKQKQTLVAVYGSLREGMENSSLHDSAEAMHLFTGKTKEDCDLFEYASGYFPSISLKHTESGLPVVVDVYLTDMDAIHDQYDRLEGYNRHEPSDSFYNRTKVVVMAPTGDLVDAWIYHIDEITGDRVEHGDWCKHKDFE